MPLPRPCSCLSDFSYEQRPELQKVEKEIKPAVLQSVVLLDDLSAYSDELTEILLAEEEVSDEMIRGVLREATINDMAVPVLCGSAQPHIAV